MTGSMNLNIREQSAIVVSINHFSVMKKICQQNTKLVPKNSYHNFPGRYLALIGEPSSGFHYCILACLLSVVKWTQAALHVTVNSKEVSMSLFRWQISIRWFFCSSIRRYGTQRVDTFRYSDMSVMILLTLTTLIWSFLQISLILVQRSNFNNSSPCSCWDP